MDIMKLKTRNKNDPDVTMPCKNTSNKAISILGYTGNIVMRSGTCNSKQIAITLLGSMYRQSAAHIGADTANAKALIPKRAILRIGGSIWVPRRRWAQTGTDSPPRKPHSVAMTKVRNSAMGEATYPRATMIWIRWTPGSTALLSTCTEPLHRIKEDQIATEEIETFRNYQSTSYKRHKQLYNIHIMIVGHTTVSKSWMDENCCMYFHGFPW